MEEILTIKEVSSMLKFSPRTIKRLISDDEFPHIQAKKWGSLRFFKSQVIKWLEEHHKPVPMSIKIERIKNL